jgi:hypothetical protein
MPRKSDANSDKNRKRKKYSKPKLTRHGELSKTALAHSY